MTPSTKRKPKRVPIVRQRSPWTEVGSDVVIGIDPGFASLGAVVIYRPPGELPRVVRSELIETQKAPKKNRSSLRVSHDDLRRYSEIYGKASKLVQNHQVVAMGIEVYQPGFQGSGGARRGGGAASKTMAVYGMLLGLGFAHRLFVSAGNPADVKRRFAGRVKASKEEVIERMRGVVVGIGDFLDEVPKTKREHLADAAAHAVLALEELDEARIRLGL